MRRLLRAFAACLLALTLVVGLLPGRHACALAASTAAAQDAGADAAHHACCKGKEGAERAAAMAEMPSPEAAIDLAQDDRCSGTCCVGATQAVPSAAPPLPLPSTAAVGLVPPSPPEVAAADPTLARVAHGPRGPPPPPAKLRLHLRNCVLRN